MLQPDKDGKCPVCGEESCREVQQFYGFTAFSPSSGLNRGDDIAQDRENKVTVKDRVFHNGALVYSSGSRVDRAHAEMLGADYIEDKPPREVSVDEYDRTAAAEDIREVDEVPPLDTEPHPSEGLEPTKKRRRPKGAETDTEA